MKAEALIGKVLGTCTLQKIIGQGGMGAVFLAQQSRPHRQVAVKVLLPATTLTSHQRAAFLERFRRETDAAASLEHPNILPVHEYGERDGYAYLVVPYISGGTLRDVMEKEGPLPLARALNYLEQVAAALDFAHERGVIHRDIKPANILMTPEGRLLLTDFGLVKIIADGQTPQMRLTGAGAPVGTPDYMSPEQVVGNMVDGRADLYSLGVILYQMVTGITPFQGETPMQIAAQQWQSPPPSPRLLRADLPVSAEQVLLKAMAKSPADRYACGYDFAEAFRGALTFAGVPLNGAAGGTLPIGASTSARLFTPRGLFDPSWQSEATGELASQMDGRAPAMEGAIKRATATAGLAPTEGVFPAASAEAARPAGLLSRTGMFPKVSATTFGASAPLARRQDQSAVGAINLVGGLGEPRPLQEHDQSGSYGASPELGPRPLLMPRLTGVLPAYTGSQPAAMPTAVQQSSPVRNTTGALAIPNSEQAGGNTLKLTGPVKVVQMPVAGQPGRYVTGLLPVVPQTPTSETQAVTGKRKGAINWAPTKIAMALLVVLVISSAGAAFWYAHSRPGQTTTNPGATSTTIKVTPNATATATAQAQATADANKILSDPLSQNIHNFPIGPNEFFSNGAYHILNTQGNAVAVVLPEQPFSVPNAYTLTMWEVKGDDTSNNNSFGMIIRFSQQTKAGKTTTTFYSFEVLNIKGGEYRFYKYDDSQGAPDKDWTQLWHQPFGREYNQGQGQSKLNTIRIYQNGSSFSFTVNGKLIATVHDGSLKSGSLGMLVNLKGTEVAFMNMLITHN